MTYKADGSSEARRVARDGSPEDLRARGLVGKDSDRDARRAERRAMIEEIRAEAWAARRAERDAILEEIIAANRAVEEGKAAALAKYRPRPLTEEERFEREFPFAARAERREEAERQHRARRRAVEAEVARQDRLYRSIRDSHGKDYADRLFAGGGYAI